MIPNMDVVKRYWPNYIPEFHDHVLGTFSLIPLSSLGLWSWLSYSLISMHYILGARECIFKATRKEMGRF